MESESLFLGVGEKGEKTRCFWLSHANGVAGFSTRETDASSEAPALSRGGKRSDGVCCGVERSWRDSENFVPKRSGKARPGRERERKIREVEFHRWHCPLVTVTHEQKEKR